jgi:hypothetical protein
MLMHRPVMRVPSTRGVHQGCVLGATFSCNSRFSVMHKVGWDYTPNESIVSGYSDDGYFLGPHVSLVAIGEAMPAAYICVGLTATIRKNCLYFPLGVVDLSITYQTTT